MILYVAGASSERARVRAAMQAVHDSEHVLSHDWLEHVEAETRADADIPTDEQIDYARGDLEGIENSDVFWLLAPREPSTGAWLELGYALGCRDETGDPLIVVSGDARRSIFASLADHSFRTDSEAWAWFKELGGRGT